MWILRRLKSLGCPIPELLIVLREQIVSICEVGVAWWGPMITKHESNMLERVLKTGLHIIFQDKYQNFKNALKLGKLQSLRQRRIVQITKFCKKSYKNPRFKTWFCEEPHQPPLRERRCKRAAPLLKPVTCRTQRYARSSLPLMTSILSWHPPLLYTPIDLAWASSNPCSSWLLCCLLVPTEGCFSIVLVLVNSIYGCSYILNYTAHIYIKKENLGSRRFISPLVYFKSRLTWRC